MLESWILPKNYTVPFSSLKQSALSSRKYKQNGSERLQRETSCKRMSGYAAAEILLTHSLFAVVGSYPSLKCCKRWLQELLMISKVGHSSNHVPSMWLMHKSAMGIGRRMYRLVSMPHWSMSLFGPACAMSQCLIFLTGDSGKVVKPEGAYLNVCYKMQTNCHFTTNTLL